MTQERVRSSVAVLFREVPAAATAAGVLAHQKRRRGHCLGDRTRPKNVRRRCKTSTQLRASPSRHCIECIVAVIPPATVQMPRHCQASGFVLPTPPHHHSTSPPPQRHPGGDDLMLLLLLHVESRGPGITRISDQLAAYTACHPPHFTFRSMRLKAQRLPHRYRTHHRPTLSHVNDVIWERRVTSNGRKK
jgi:hypothetical protein